MATAPSPVSARNNLLDIPTEVLKKATTYCGQLSQEILKDSKNFTRTDSHYTVDGLAVYYKSKIDNRTYIVHISTKDS